MSLDTSALNGLVDELDNDVEEAVRPAAQAASQVLYEAVRQNVSALGRKTGNLYNSIYQAYSEDKSAPGKATYHVSWRTARSSGLPIAPHGHLIEYGHIQRYAVYVGKDGQWHTAVRPEKQGTPRPRRGASQAEKDAYYLPRPGGPVQWLAKPFVRGAASRFPQALDAAEAELLKRINKQ
jgi:hypothetical protein